MNKVLLSLIAFFAFGNFSFSQFDNEKINIEDQKEESWKTKEGEDYQLNYPPDWEVNDDIGMGLSFAILSPLDDENDQFRENVGLVIQDLSGYGITLDQFAELSEGQIKTMITDSKILFNEKKTMNDTEYQKVIYTGKQGIYELKYEQYYWVINEKAYILTLTGSLNGFDQYQEVGEKIMNSFSVK